MLLNNKQIEQINQLIIEVGEQVKNYYYSDAEITVDYKADDSPITIADKEASRLLIEGLTEIDQNIKIISEEEDHQANLALLQNNKLVWIIDPIDGTKSFLNHRGDFTLNICLFENNIPIFGSIYHPLKEILYYTGEHNIAYKRTKEHEQIIKVRERDNYDNLLAVISHRNINEMVKEFYRMLAIKKFDQVSSSLKFCLVAEGKYDLYANFAKIFLWDIAAGHAIINAAGGVLLDIEGKRLCYDNTTLLAPQFISCAGYLEDYLHNISLTY